MAELILLFGNFVRTGGLLARLFILSQPGESHCVVLREGQGMHSRM